MTASTVALLAGLSAGGAQAEDLTLGWAAWDPANALAELSKDVETRSGNTMHFEFVPWPNFADRMLNEMNSGGKLCDLLIGDSLWIGGAAENNQYMKLNDFFDANGIKMSDFIPATVVGDAEWPKNTGNYWALPVFGDVVGWTYRKDWFAKPELQAEFKKTYGRDLAPPKSLDELTDIAKFFQGREIDACKSGQVALQMNFAFVWPGVNTGPNVGGDPTGYFANPRGSKGDVAQLGGQGMSVVANTEHKDAAPACIKWFAQADVQKKWWTMGGYSALSSVANDPSFVTSQPCAQTFRDSMAMVKDFRAEPSCASLLLAMQQRVQDYVVAGNGTAQEALDALVKDWTEVFTDEGKL